MHHTKFQRTTTYLLISEEVVVEWKTKASAMLLVETHLKDRPQS